MRVPNDAELERRLGIPLGRTLRALIHLAYELAPNRPHEAFGALFLRLDWITPNGPSAATFRTRSTPPNIRVFGRTGGDMHHFGFLMDGRRSTDKRPIVYIAKDWPPAHVIAPNLASFLGLVALSGAAWMERTTSNREWRHKLDVGEARASRMLLTIRGVRVPERPYDVANAHPDIEFEYPELPPLPEEPRARRRRVPVAEAALEDCFGFARDAQAAGRLTDALAYATRGASLTTTASRSRALEVELLATLGQLEKARARARALIKEWLAEKAPSPPRLHPRADLDRRAISIVAAHLDTPERLELLRAIEATPEAPPLPEGDFI